MNKKKVTIKYIDLFAGIGGFHLGLENANKYGLEASFRGNSEAHSKVQKPESSTNRGDGKGGRTRTFTCVYTNEWNKYAAQIYKKHYGEIDTTDITKVKAKDIPDFDLLCAGFPCQSFSVAGKRRGFDDTRGTLFFDIARIAAEKRPRYLLLENVKGLLSHAQGKTFKTILGVLADLGYECEWQVLNSKYFGVPQNRERVFIIGHLGGGSGRKVFPISGQSGDDISNKRKTQFSRSIAYTLDANYYKGVSPKGYQGSKRQLVWRQPLKYLNRNQKNIEGDYAFTVDGSQTSGIKKGTRIRRLTPTECARLQGFPDNWCDGLSDTQQYKCYGNAVTTNVITAIGNKLIQIQ